MPSFLFWRLRVVKGNMGQVSCHGGLLGSFVSLSNLLPKLAPGIWWRKAVVAFLILLWAGQCTFSAATENLGQLAQYFFFFLNSAIYLWWIIAVLVWVIIFYSQEYRCLNLGSWVCFQAPKDVAWFSSFEHHTALGNFSNSENEATSVDA